MKNKSSDETPTGPSKKIKTDQGKKPYQKPTTKKPPPGKKQNDKGALQEKPEDWNKFKKEKKELRLKRRQSKGNYELVNRAKSLGEKVRRKTLKGGDEERNKLINDLHNLLKNKGEYAKFVLAHDTARIVQWLLKYSSKFVVDEISKELIPVTVDMLQSKYGIYCVKRLLKYGSPDVRTAVIDGMLGNAVKLSCHSVSASVVEMAYSTWATPQQKQYLVQEFYGDLYKSTKDKNVKHIRDAYKDNPSLKTAILGACKENIQKIINKGLLDSGLVQTVISQFLTECSDEARNELISLLVPHIVVISNSREGARAAMHCIWHGSNKDRKVIMKTLKEHIVELSKHEHGHSTVICLIDAADDTVLLNKIVIAELVKNIKDLSKSEWGSKVLLYLIDPLNTKMFHPQFQTELKSGREQSTSKKSPETRRQEILQHSLKPLMDLVKIEPEFWLSSSALALQMLVIVKNGTGEHLEEAYKSIVEVITNPEWKIKENETETLGVEHAGLHMVLKKLAQNDKSNVESGQPTFGKFLADKLNDELLSVWLKLNRGCFLLLNVFENGTKETQDVIKKKLKKHVKLLKGETTQGAKILLKKVS